MFQEAAAPTVLGGGAVMRLIWPHPFPLSTPGLTFVSPGLDPHLSGMRRSFRDKALIPTEVGRSRPGSSEEAFGAVTRQRRRRWRLFRSPPNPCQHV